MTVFLVSLAVGLVWEILAASRKGNR